MKIEKIERRDITFESDGDNYTDIFPGEIKYYLKIGDKEIELEKEDYYRIEIR